MLFVAIPKSVLAQKPAYGSPCNHCGICCKATICITGMRVMKIDDRGGRDQNARLGPCPAYNDGLGGCGLMLSPQDYDPEATRQHGAYAMSEAAKLIIGSGTGCDKLVEGERGGDDEFMDRIHARAIRLRRQLDAARKRWGL